MKLLLESEDAEHIQALCGYLLNKNIHAFVAGQDTFATSPGAILKLGLWIGDDEKYAEALASIEDFERVESGEHPTSSTVGRPTIARRTDRLAILFVVGAVFVLGLYLLAQVLN